MSKMSDMAATIKELRNAAAAITDVANWLTEMFSTTAAVDEAQESEPVSTPEPQLTLEQVRAVLAGKSRMGFTAEIRTLLQKYGAAKLSGIDPANYKALVADAEVLGNGN